ncbi:MAG: hypothetical protein V4577_18855 [Bacteroidota bacterium]
MVDGITTAVDYFSAHEGYFWHWAEHGRVIEFANKRTICYREDLTYLLDKLPGEVRFPLGSILLLLCACKDGWESNFEAEQQLMRVSVVQGFTSANYAAAAQMKNSAYAFLKIVNSLPATERTGLRRTALISDIAATIGNDASLPARVHLYDADGKPVNPRQAALPFFKDHFVCDGAAKVAHYRRTLELLEV